MTQSPIIISEIFYKRLLLFATDCQGLVTILPKNIWNQEYSSQLIRSSASPGANYIEAIEAASPRDFTHRLKICRKESKESIHWLTLIKHANNKLPDVQSKTEKLISEARELSRFFHPPSLPPREKSTNQKNDQINEKWKMINDKYKETFLTSSRIFAIIDLQ